MDLIEKATQNLTANELTAFSHKYRKQCKKKEIAYICWVLFGAFGGHRFYLGCYGIGLIVLAITVFTLGLGAVFGWLDIVNIPRLVERENKEIALGIIKEVKRK